MGCKGPVSLCVAPQYGVVVVCAWWVEVIVSEATESGQGCIYKPPHNPSSKVQGWGKLNVEFRLLSTVVFQPELCKLVFKDRSWPGVGPAD